MKLKEINKTEFENFCAKSELDNFFQSKYYAEIKRYEGYHTYFVGLDNNGNIVAATMLLSKEISFLRKRSFYAPRGFITNYKNSEIIEEFTKQLVDYINKKNGAYIKINPNLILYDRDYEGNIIEGGINNSKIIEKLKEIGWVQNNYNLKYPLEDSLIYKINLKERTENEIYNEFSDNIKNILTKNENIGISTRKLEKENLTKFIDILEESTNLIDYLNINYKNYKDIINILDSHNMIEITIAELNIDKYLEELIKNSANEEEIEFAKKLQYEYGHKIILGAILGVAYHKEYYALIHTSVDRTNKFNALSTLYYETIKKAKKTGFETYNLYTIGTSINNNQDLEIAKQYHGKVYELIGEFDYIINNHYYKKAMKKQKKSSN